MAEVVVVTGAGAGVGRATVRALARAGYDVGLLGRDKDRLEAAAAEIRSIGRRACVAPCDVADAGAVEAAASAVEAALGPIAVWVNNAMATVFAPVAETTAEEVRRGTEVTYLGTVHGMMAALRRMRPRNRGTIINVGSALAYRSVPLQAVYCGAKSAIRGFTDSLRSELLHDGCDIKLTMVHLPAVNTPQFDWARNKLGRRAQPVPPVYQPEVPARAILFAATQHRREIWVGFPTIKAILANRIAPAYADRVLARMGYSGQITDMPLPADAPDNLFRAVPGGQAAHGRFDAVARRVSVEMFTDRYRYAVFAGLVGALVGIFALGRWAGVKGRLRRAEAPPLHSGGAVTRKRAAHDGPRSRSVA
jgi:short-subunit dehydrogenase